MIPASYMHMYLQDGLHYGDSFPCSWRAKQDVGGGAALPSSNSLHSCPLAWIQGKVEELVLVLVRTGDTAIRIRRHRMRVEFQQWRFWTGKPREQA